MSKILHLETVLTGKERLALQQWANKQLAEREQETRQRRRKLSNYRRRPQPTEPPKKAA